MKKHGNQKQDKMKEEFITPIEWLGMCGYTEEEVKKYYYMKELEEQILYSGQMKTVVLGLNEDKEESNRQRIKQILEKRKLLKDKLGE